MNRLSLPFLRPLTLGVALGAVIALNAQVATAEVYRWVDEKGAVHYSDRKPDGVESKQMKLKTGTSTAVTEDPMAAAKALDETKAAEADAAYKADYNKEQKAVDQERCKVARENLNILNTRPRITVEENGEKRYLTPEEITAKKAELQQIVDQECQP